jgi:flavin reductase (DIM6/NTAB) family NADH-FMN oxidoreductase RutF
MITPFPGADMPVTSDELRIAMRRWATGVTLVTAAHNGVRHGMTVSSFTSLSLEPPYVMVSLECGTRTHDLVRDSGAFGVTLLALEQRHISHRFSAPHTELGHRFDGLETFTLLTGAPFLTGALAWFDSRIASLHHAGTHTVFIGEVVAVRQGEDAAPLLYFNQNYRKLS